MLYKKLIGTYKSAFEAAKARKPVEELEADGGVPQGDLAAVIRNASNSKQGVGMRRFDRAVAAVCPPEEFLRNLSRPDIAGNLRTIISEFDPKERTPPEIKTLRKKLSDSLGREDSGLAEKIRDLSSNRYSDPANTLTNIRTVCMEIDGSQSELYESISILAVNYQFNGDLYRAAWLFHLACSGFLTNGDGFWAKSAMRSGHLFLETGRPDAAKAAFSVATTVFLLESDLESYGTCLLNLANAYYYLGWYSPCIQLARLAEKTVDAAYLRLTAHQLVAWCLLQQGKHSDALPFVTSVVNGARGKGLLEAYAAYLKGRYLAATGCLSEACEELQAAATFFRRENRFDYCLCSISLIQAQLDAGKSPDRHLINDIKLTVATWGDSNPMIRAARLHLNRLQLARARQCLEKGRHATRIYRRCINRPF